MNDATKITMLFVCLLINIAVDFTQTTDIKALKESKKTECIKDD